jgi:putative flippase GtrA
VRDEPVAWQGLRFAAVGVIATVAHVGTALAVGQALNWAPGYANLAGYAVAVWVSYAGHARFTFATGNAHARHLPRFLAVSLSGLLASALVTYVICTVLGGSLALAMIAVVALVPGASFAASRLWAFRMPPAPMVLPADIHSTRFEHVHAARCE